MLHTIHMALAVGWRPSVLYATQAPYEDYPKGVTFDNLIQLYWAEKHGACAALVRAQSTVACGVVANLNWRLHAMSPTKTSCSRCQRDFINYESNRPREEAL